MKKHLLVFAVLISLSVSAMATHLMGGEIVARHLSGYDYEVTLTTYRDTLGIPMQTTAYFDILDGAGMNVGSFSTQYDTLLSGNVLPSYPYGVEVYVFHDTVTMPGPGTYHIGWDDCCRNGAILNMSNPLGESMFLETMLTVYAAPAVNSSPIFLVQPVIFLPVNTPWQYNPLPFDYDGDSLVWSLDTPFTAFQTNVSGFTTPPSDPSGPFSLDPVTGTISWSASMVGNFDATVLVEEYRNGQKIGEIRRDMQLIVVPSGNKLARFSNFDNIPKNAAGYPFVSIKEFVTYNLSLLAIDDDINDPVFVESYGEPFLFEVDYPSFSTQPTGNGNEVEATFSWTPTSEMVRERPYMIVFRVKDHEFAYDYTLLLEVASWATGIEEPTTQSVNQIYPNPVTSAMYIPLTLDNAAEVTFSVYNYAGMRIKDLGNAQYAAGEHLVITTPDLEAGMYLLVTEINGVPTTTHKFVVAK